MATTDVAIRPVVDGLFTIGPDATLLTSTCRECGSTFFPRRLFCRNPECGRATVRDTVLSRRGALHSVTVQHYMPPPPFRLDPALLPFGIALVAFPEGIRVMGIVHESVDPKALRIGMEMEVTTGLLYRDDDGAERVTWKFRPVGDRR